MQARDIRQMCVSPNLIPVMDIRASLLLCCVSDVPSLCSPRPPAWRSQPLAAAVFCDPPTSPLCFVWRGFSCGVVRARGSSLRILPTYISYPFYQRRGRATAEATRGAGVAGEPLRRVDAPTPLLLRSPPLAKVQSHSHHLLRQVLSPYLAVPPRTTPGR